MSQAEQGSVHVASELASFLWCMSSKVQLKRGHLTGALHAACMFGAVSGGVVQSGAAAEVPACVRACTCCLAWMCSALACMRKSHSLQAVQIGDHPKQRSIHCGIWAVQGETMQCKRRQLPMQAQTACASVIMSEPQNAGSMCSPPVLQHPVTKALGF